jgi:hypothetical protein
MNIADIVSRARMEHAPMRVRTFRLTDGQYHGLHLLAQQHGLRAGAVLRAVIEEFLAAAERENRRGD